MINLLKLFKPKPWPKYCAIHGAKLEIGARKDRFDEQTGKLVKYEEWLICKEDNRCPLLWREDLLTNYYIGPRRTIKVK